MSTLHPHSHPGKPGPIPRSFTLDNRSHTIKEWSEITGMSALVIRQRLNRGASIGEALTAPCVKRKWKKPGVASVSKASV